ncbi:hypothetical protein NLU13_3228 [Sarocladium strictum]|uniref:DUF726-domain-containing protein n=1 Tax=Sarocladium strictum TaxID=5046 RepID=A0AA39GN17_SARSR|nr:hypothetical protein NLU13_3228 [Sarocladium strictum]
MDDKPAGSPDTGVQSPSPPVAEERDDFGLPIRKPVEPPPIEDVERVESNAHGSEVKEEAKAPKVPAGQEVTQNNVAKEKDVPDADTDEEAFEDAQSKAPSEAGGSPPKPTSDDPKLASPKPGSSAKDEPKLANDSQTDALKTPKALAEADDRNDATEVSDGANGAKEALTKTTSSQETIADPSPKTKETVDLGAKTREDNPADRRGSVLNGMSAGDAPVGEFSHQKLPEKEKAEAENQEEDDWQEMPSYARYDMYNDDDKLIAREHDDAEDEKVQYSGLGGAGKGYTRVQMDEDAESATSMDDHTKYLFKGGGLGTSMTEGDDEEARTAVSQMQATKDLLTEGQRIAYVGVVKLEIAKMIKEREDMPTTKKVKKDTAMAAEAMKMWGQKMMIRLYAHMDISEAEQIMIEQLAEHGVVPKDLTPALLTNARVSNPMAQSRSSEDLDDESEGEDGGPKPETGKSTESDKAFDAREDRRDSSEAGKLPEYPEDDELPARPPPPYQAVGGDDLPEVKTPSQMPKTEEIEIDLRWTVLCDLFLILIADSIYDARSRTLLEKVGESLDVPDLDICRFEKRVTDALEMQQAAEKENWNEDEHMEARRKKNLKRRYMMMGLATVGGGLVIGLSAGVLAPAIGAGLAAGFSTIGIGGTTAFLGGVGGAAIITTTAATSGGIVGVRAANRRTGAVKTFQYQPLHNNKRLNLIVTVSGWLTGKMDDVRLPFSTVDPIVGDMYSVLWEPEMLRSMGDTINILATEALTSGLQQVLGNTILVGLMAALQLPVVLSKLSYLIDNPWAVSLDRAWSAGQILADSIIERNLGTRPITLVGYSIGARVIFSCLQELAKKGAYGLVQNVYMFGTPIVVKKEEYLRARGVVSGRFVNGWHKNDWILGYLFRLTNGGIRRVAGLAPITELDFIENVDVTDLVKGHMEYRKAIPSLLLKCGWPVESEEFTEIEEPDPENHGERQRELINEIEEARKELEREGKAAQKSSNRFSLWSRNKKTGKAEWEVYEDKDKDKGSGSGDAGKADEPWKPSNDNHGVLFDVDAIRAELAREQMGYNNVEEELQIREIKSTLPPMRIEVPANPALSPASIHRPLTARGSPRADVLPPRPSYSSPGSVDRGSRAASPAYLRPITPVRQADPPDHGMQMTFDTSFDDDASRRPTPPPKEGSLPGRPEMKSAQTLPNIALHDPWADPDDEDFGKEKEVTMTFA